MRSSAKAWAWCAAIAVLWLGAGDAFAGPPPVVLPEHDMVGVYRVSPSGRPSETWRVRYAAGAERARITSLDGAGTGMVILLDMRNLTAEMVLPQMHAVVTIPDVAAAMQHVLSGGGARFTALGQTTIAHHRCTRYLVLKPSAQGTACITADGVLLAGEGKDARGSAQITALSMREEAQPMSAFVTPAGYSRINLPPGMLAQLLNHQG